jgi:hypothetical protein
LDVDQLAELQQQRLFCLADDEQGSHRRYADDDQHPGGDEWSDARFAY